MDSKKSILQSRKKGNVREAIIDLGKTQVVITIKLSDKRRDAIRNFIARYTTVKEGIIGIRLNDKTDKALEYSPETGTFTLECEGFGIYFDKEKTEPIFNWIKTIWQ